MTAKTKWIVYGSLALIAILLTVIFSKNIWNWFENVLIDVLIYLVVFATGWMLGRFGGKRRTTTEENVRNITEAQR